MENRILVAYASRCGSTGKAAEAIGQAISKEGATVDVRLVKDVADLSPYRAVIVGSAVRAGKWLPEAVKFVKTHQEVLSQIPVAYFVVCMTMQEDTEENRREVLAYLDPVREKTPQVHPVDVGLFAGVLDRGRLSFFFRLMMKVMRATEGDFLDLDAIHTWATDILPTLLSE